MYVAFFPENQEQHERAGQLHISLLEATASLEVNFSLNDSVNQGLRDSVTYLQKHQIFYPSEHHFCQIIFPPSLGGYGKWVKSKSKCAPLLGCSQNHYKPFGTKIGSFA